jgi:hypothetical protein
MKTSMIISGALCGLLLAGCSTPHQVANSEGKAMVRTYNAEFAPVWRSTIDAVQMNGLEITSANRSTGYIEARRTIRPHTFGENVGVWVKSHGPTQTDVEVLSRQAGPPVAWFKNWENEIHRSVAANMTRESVGTAPGTTSIERGTVPGIVVVQEPPVTTTVAPTTQPAPIVNSKWEEQRRTVYALRAERDQRQRDLSAETDPARRDAIERQIDRLQTDLQREEQKLKSYEK